MEWLIVACVDFLEQYGLHEQNIFAVSAVDHLVRGTTIALLSRMPDNTDPHVAAGVIKDKIRHAEEPLIDKQCLRAYIEALGEGVAQAEASTGNAGGGDADNSNPDAGVATAADGSLAVASTFRETFLAKTIEATRVGHGARRAYILARFLRLLGRVSANVESSRMAAHSLAKCVAPSMLHWDPNANFALLMLGRITAYVKKMVEEARAYDEQLCQMVEELGASGGW